MQPDLMHAGGFTEVRKIASLADTYYVPVAPHNPGGPICTAVGACGPCSSNGQCRAIDLNSPVCAPTGACQPCAANAQCGSIDTVEQNFLHCYACGNVGAQEEYLTQGGLGCPKCSARLRHIGVDYDRALETLACRGCGGRFTQPDVKARCLQCSKLSRTDELAERRYYGLRLSAAGELAARTGQVGDLFKLMDEFSQAHPEYFTRTLEWLLGLPCRLRERSVTDELRLVEQVRPSRT